MQKAFLFEACCGSAEDVIQAAAGGADRVELNSDLFHGGLTPTIGSLIYAKEKVNIPVMCMVRPREGGFCYTDCEFEVMQRDARLLLEHGADGIVFGCLCADGTLDAERCKIMLDIIGDKQRIFHRAIDVVPDPLATLTQLIALGFTRVLTSGQAPEVPRGVKLIRQMVELADGRIDILPGGGITPENAAWCLAQCGTGMLHAAAHRTLYDNSAMGNPAIYFGGAVYPPEDRFQVTDAGTLRALRSAVEISQ